MVFRDRVSWQRLWTRASLLHLPIVLGLTAAYLLSYDVRLPQDWCFQPIIVIPSFATLVIIQLLSAGLPVKSSHAANALTVERQQGGQRLAWQWVLLVAITAAGAIIRASGVLTSVWEHDEVAMALISQSIRKVGFPYVMSGSYKRILSTYELVPYPIALSCFFLGPTTLAYRLPALIFGSLITPLVGWCGRRMFDWRVGLAAAAIWALLPIPINWSEDAFHLSQEGFFALATFWFFYEAIRNSELNTRYLKFSVIAFVLTYFSWEGIAFVVPSLLITAIILKWREWDWRTYARVWWYFSIVGAIVILQLCFRQLTLIPQYLGVVRDLSEMTAPGLVPLDPLVFNPLFYIYNCFLAENHVVLTLVALAGVVFIRKRPALNYLYLVLLMLYFSYTMFLDHYSARYCFSWMPLLVLAACASFFALWDRVAELAATKFTSMVRAGCCAVALMLLLLSSNEYVLKLFRTAPDPTAPVWFDRVDVPFKADYQSADRFVADNMKAGDVVVTTTPHVFFFITGRRPDYAIDADMASRMFYDQQGIKRIYIDKWMGLPLLRDVHDLQDAQARASRVWFIGDAGRSQSPELASYIRDHAVPVFETANQRIYLLPGAPRLHEHLHEPPIIERASAKRVAGAHVKGG